MNERRPNFLSSAVVRWGMLVLCLFAPVALAIVRKFAPGQPVAIRFVTVGMILLAALWAFRRKPQLPSGLAMPLLFWALLLFVYAVPGILVNPRLFVAAVLVYIVPLSLARVAVGAMTTEDAILRLGRCFGVLTLALLPIAIIVVVSGNEVLPDWLRATHDARDAYVEFTKSHFHAPSAIFSTPSVLADTIFATTYFSMACLEIVRKQKKREFWWWLFIIAGVVIVYLTGRRGTFLALAPGLAYTLLRQTKGLRWRIVAVVALAGLLVALDQIGLANDRLYSSRTDLYQDLDWGGRFFGVFGMLTLRWLEMSPFGNFVGYGSALGGSFGIELSSPVEVGAAMLVAEMGIVGLFTMPLVVGYLSWWCYSRSRTTIYKHAVRVLLIFQVTLFTLFFTKAIAHLLIFSVAHLLFWANWGICVALIRLGRQRSAERSTNRRDHRRKAKGVPAMRLNRRR